MQIIPALPPGANACAVIPFIRTDPHGFIDTRNVTLRQDQHIYVSYKALVAMGQMYGMVEEDEAEALRAHIDDLKCQLEQAQEDLKEYDQRFDAIDSLESAGFTARKKTGRPKKVADGVG